MRVTAEVTPHHLLLTDELAAELRPGLQGQPAAAHATPTSPRCAQALIDGMIDIVATDHAPHAVEDKECEWAYARPGHARPGDRAVGRARACSATQLGPDRRPDVAARRPGSPGWPATATTSRSARRPTSRWSTRPPAGSSTRPSWPAAAATPRTPGMTLPGRIVATFLRGEPTVLDGKAVK